MSTTTLIIHNVVKQQIICSGTFIVNLYLLLIKRKELRMFSCFNELISKGKSIGKLRYDIYSLINNNFLASSIMINIDSDSFLSGNVK
jgi:hypothetical protein